MALTHSNPMEIGDPAPPFSLPGTDGRDYSLDSFSESKALLVVFTCNHCPYAQAYEERLVKIQQDYRDRGLFAVAISSNDAARYPEDSFELMKKRAVEQGYNFPYLYDESQEVAKAYDAACTPDIYLFDGAQKLVYHGRIDDSWKDPRKVTREDLRHAIDATLADQPVDFDVLPAMGCSIKWKS